MSEESTFLWSTIANEQLWLAAIWAVFARPSPPA